MIEFLSFKQMISIPALIVFYYLGAVFLPIAVWFFCSWLLNKIDPSDSWVSQGKTLFHDSLCRKQKIIVSILFAFSFLLAELFWRIMFEFLIAFMQMRETLLQLSTIP